MILIGRSEAIKIAFFSKKITKIINTLRNAKWKQKGKKLQLTGLVIIPNIALGATLQSKKKVSKLKLKWLQIAAKRYRRAYFKITYACIYSTHLIQQLHLSTFLQTMEQGCKRKFYSTKNLYASNLMENLYTLLKTIIVFQ